MAEIPDFELINIIGEGAYGEVWLGRSVTGEYRAIKLVRRDKFDHDRPFEREFNGIKQFEPISREHEGLVSILHIGRNEEERFFYYVMELADSRKTNGAVKPEEYAPRTLRSELTSRENLPISECLSQGVHLARALAQLHANGLVHRDIKPANIIYLKGKPMLADIGLVKAMDDSVSLAGTIGYVPLEGPGRKTGDIFSLGKVLYEMLTGLDRTEFPSIPDSFQNGSRPELSRLNQIIFKACERDPEKRYQNADQLALDLEQLEGQELSVEAAMPFGLVRKSIACMAVLIVTCILLLLFAFRSPNPQYNHLKSIKNSGDSGRSVSIDAKNFQVSDDVSPISISFWLKHEGKGGGLLEIKESYDNLLSFALTDDGRVYMKETRGKTSQAQVKAGFGGFPVGARKVGSIPLDKWVHFCALVGEDIRVYLDNVYVFEAQLGNLDLPSKTVVVGQSSASRQVTLGGDVHVTASPLGLGGLTGKRLVDGNRTNLFHGSDYKNHTFTIDLGKAYSVSGISMLEGFYRLNPRYNDFVHGVVKSFGLSVSNDGKNFVEVFAPYRLDEKLVRNMAYSRVFSPTKARYWRIHATDRHGVVVFISEIELWAHSKFDGDIKKIEMFEKKLSRDEVGELFDNGANSE